MQHNSAISIETSPAAAERFFWKEYYPMSRQNSAASARSKGRVPSEKRGRVRRHLERCAASGKVRFRDKREALAAVHAACARRRFAEADETTTSRQERRTYSCANCHGWHITSQESWGDASSARPSAAPDAPKPRIDRAVGPRRVFLATRRTADDTVYQETVLSSDSAPRLDWSHPPATWLCRASVTTGSTR